MDLVNKTTTIIYNHKMSRFPENAQIRYCFP